MSFDNTEWVWKNGSLTHWSNATVHVSSHSLHYGSGVFEGMRCYDTADGPAVFRMDAHFNRFYASAGVHGIEIPYTREELEAATAAVVLRNNFRSCYVRPICYYGSSSLGLHPRNCPVEVVMLAWPWETYLGAESLEAGVRVTVSSWTKFHSRMIPTTAKGCGGYMNSTLAVREAVEWGFDEALLLDADGNIAEGTGENLFMVRGDRLLTNDERSSILLGITRDAVIKIARDLGYEVEVGTLRIEDLLAADEAFFTGTAAEVTPIREVDGQQIGTGSRGAVTEKIQQAFFAATSGRDARYKDWLRLVAEKPATVAVQDFGSARSL